jgi:hypothetical protein
LMEDLSTILEIFGEAQGFGHGAALREFSSRNGFRPIFDDGARYDAAKAAGNCTECRKPVQGRVVCEVCCKKVSEALKVRRAERAAVGCCPRCGGERDVETVECRSCLERNASREAKRRKRTIVAGVCFCGGARVDGKKRCLRCLEKKRHEMKLYRQRKANAT